MTKWKLIAHRNTGSDKHLQDARGVLLMRWGRLDLEAIERGAQASGVQVQYNQLLDEVRKEAEAE